MTTFASQKTYTRRSICSGLKRIARGFRIAAGLRPANVPRALNDAASVRARKLGLVGYARLHPTKGYKFERLSW